MEVVVKRTAHNPALRDHPSVVVDTNSVTVAGEARRTCVLGAGARRRVVGTHAKAKLDVAVAIDSEERTKPDSSLDHNMFVG